MDLQVQMSVARRGEIAFALLRHITIREGAQVKMEAFLRKLFVEMNEIGVSETETIEFAAAVLTPNEQQPAVPYDQTYSRRHPDNDRRKV